MAQRRMMSMHIVDSDAFLDMPQSTQNLYMHMLMRADDDGFVSNPKKIGRMVGSSSDDLEILLAKKFIIPFESGVCVIKHWKIHNYIQKDRYQATKYTEEMALLSVKSNGGYTLDTECIQNGDTGKVRLGKSKVKQDEKEDVSFSSFWEAYPKKVGKGAAEKSWEKMKPDLTVVLKSLKEQKQTDQWKKDSGQFIPNPATWLNQKRWEDVVSTQSNFDEIKL